MSFEEIYPKDRFANEAGVILEQLNDDHAVMTLKVEDRHLNAGNTVHGGVLFLLADITMAAKANHNRSMTVSIQSDIRFLSAAVEGDVLTAEAVEVFGRKTLYNSRVTIKNQKGDLIAISEGLYYTLNR